ncbi:hypothetical protein NMG60_11029573 [Bertholletia excelsa]
MLRGDRGAVGSGSVDMAARQRNRKNCGVADAGEKRGKARDGGKGGRLKGREGRREQGKKEAPASGEGRGGGRPKGKKGEKEREKGGRSRQGRERGMQAAGKRRRERERRR